MEDLEEIKKSIQNRIDAAIERIQRFLDKAHRYTAEVEPDPFNTGKIWFLKIGRNNSYIILESISEANRISAEHIAKHTIMMLLVMGFSIQTKSNQDLEFSALDFKKMKEFEEFFTENDIKISYKLESHNEFCVYFSGNEKTIKFVQVGGITEKGVSILCKQLAIILGGLGKHFSTPDKTIGNRYGIVSLCP